MSNDHHTPLEKLYVQFILLMICMFVATLLCACSHSRYSEVKSTTFLFHYSDKVSPSNECSAAKNFVNHCDFVDGVIIGYDEEKSRCYPQPEYIVKTEINGAMATLGYCANELILISPPETRSTETNVKEGTK